ncbi:MAG: DUF1232 domain-containing protein [Bacteroidales bacterium]|nr:DUF1232 domain-containing protein [Bacteroidales bacterium]
MSNIFVKQFQNGKWLNKSNSLLSNKSKLLLLLGKLTGYLKKGGLAKVKEDLHLMGSYISAIVKGEYHDYSKSALTLAVAAILYVVSPLDIIPDVLPLGLIDDVSIVTWAIAQLNAELEKYKISKK